MKSFEEYTKSVYRKRDEALKRKKAKIKAAVTVSLCAALIVPASIAAVSKYQSNELLTDASAEIATQATEEYHYLLETVTYADTAYDRNFGYNENLNESVKPGNDSFDSFTYDYSNSVTEIVAEDGEVPDIYTEAAPAVTKSDDTDDLKSNPTPDFSQEEIIEAAYSALNDEEKVVADKSGAMVTIEHHTSGEENYIVMFPKNGGGFVKIKLNAKTLEIRS